jgi:hypothetical protein
MALPALTRIKITLVDTGTPSLLYTATGGTVDYADLYEDQGEDVAATVRAAASILAGYFAQQPSSVSGGGEGVSWDASRVTFYQRLASGAGVVSGATSARGPVIGSMGVATEVDW